MCLYIVTVDVKDACLIHIWKFIKANMSKFYMYLFMHININDINMLHSGAMVTSH